jgi:predicted DNA-binding transcriptional regulator AlpA
MRGIGWVEDFIGRDRSTINRWTKDPEKGFPAPRWIGNRRAWPEGEIVRWVEAQQRPTQFNLPPRAAAAGGEGEP